MRTNWITTCSVYVCKSIHRHTVKKLWQVINYGRAVTEWLIGGCCMCNNSRSKCNSKDSGFSWLVIARRNRAAMHGYIIDLSCSVLAFLPLRTEKQEIVANNKLLSVWRGWNTRTLAYLVVLSYRNITITPNEPGHKSRYSWYISIMRPKERCFAWCHASFPS